MSKKNILFLILSSALGLVLIFLWLHFIPFAEIGGYFRNLSVLPVLLASISYLAAYFVRSFRWNLLLSQQQKLPIRDTWLYAMGGNLINYLIPIRAGELIKAWFIKRNHGLGIAESLPSIFIDKTFDTLGILAVIILIPFLTIRLSVGLIGLLVVLALVFSLSLIILLMAARHKDKVSNMLIRGFAWLPGSLKPRVSDLLQRFVNSLNILEHHPAKLVAGIILTALGIALDGFYFYMLFVAFKVPFSFTMALFGYTLINLSYALPHPPAQLGSNEWLMIIIFSLGFGLTKSSASAIMAFAHVLTACLMGVLGAIAISISGFEVIRMIYKGDRFDGKPDRPDSESETSNL
ncbi:MAG TPA: lysylphosphatidylglycerol synthase transmembrane domain-containing protein [Candidatus Cloacimonadota bacterium]|nr:lysylphosphatidylglycerol synthase transmembrane domain-containing protein [Candidatus Cloacimonadota bacterium]